MKRMYITFRMALLCCFAMGVQATWAQVTTATLTGIVTDSKGETLAGATVTAEHKPSGTFYGISTRSDGRYTIPNMRVGGPYTIATSYTGYKSNPTEGIYLNLAQKLVLNLTMEEMNATLDVVEVVAETGSIMNGQRTEIGRAHV